MASLTPLLANFGANELQLLSTYGDSRAYEAGETLISEGEENEHLFLILRGQIEVLHDVDGIDKQVTILHGGDSLGEVSVFDPGPASATVRAMTAAEVYLISKSSLDELHAANPKVAYRLLSRITTCLSKRLRQMNDRVVDLVNR
jgi:CRP/FNR family transcriptional regulator, cyclic AMP receptor protein